MALSESSIRLLRSAKDSILTAEEIFELHKERTGIVAYHISQYVEKSIESKLIELDIAYPRTHNILTLLELLPNKAISKRYVWHADTLTSFSHAPCYDDMLPTVQSVREVLAYAKYIVDEASKIE
ncbi:MAG: HEPN domain-containing protein [Candidatus Methanoplasma sp.]|jgi:HEPN domain-containing protein|nr:HEPN domain-containing protein [Candidatus Methanoplasma sp.]